MFVGIDVGGANTKIATSDGFVDSRYAPLWRTKERLYDVLAEANQQFGTELEAVGAVMTGELSDCFETKREGVLYIKNALSTTFKAPHFFDRNCMFKESSEVDKDPLSFASTNWLASATFVAVQNKDAIFVDIGSTTTDVIPIVGGELKARRTDLERLKSGELIYSGILRTNIAALLKKVKLGVLREECGISSELFAITADAYLVLGHLTEDEYSCESPNRYAFAGREHAEKSRVSALRRLSRVVCSDLDELGEDGAIRIAEQVKSAQIKELRASLNSMKEKYGLDLVIAAGIGDFIVHEAADSLGMQVMPLASIYGKRIAATFPAYAVARLLAHFS
ncbi:MAG: hypothetical protein EFT35_06820 [Methanophagales archaeon ANME-1-THS]|nr:MAG: hypothetical protein EFT35_06820 [Methanophagales archaeon ANME-1-THS]